MLRSILLSAVGLLALADSISAQGAVRVERIGDRVACGSCSFRLDSVILREDERSPGLVSELSSLVTLPAGYIATQFAAQVGLPIVVDRRAAILPDHFRRGEGPGEFLVAARVVPWLGDSVLVLDPALGRVTVLAPDGRPVRAVAGSPLVRSTDVITLPSGALVASLVATGPPADGAPLQMFSGEWKKGRALGRGDGPVLPSQRARMRRRLATSGEGGFWSAQVAAYEIEQWSGDGVLQRRFAREAPWFEAHALEPPAGPAPAPRPLVLGLWEDSAARLWVVSLVADRRWRSALGEVRRSARGASASIERNDLYVDTVIEVLDVRAGAVLARTRLDGAASTVSHDGVVAMASSDADGVITTTLVRPSLVGAGAR